jgi:hypothetical protein
MPASAVDVISPAFERMKNQLFKPFRFGQWIRLAIVGLLAGEMGSAGGFNLRSRQFQGPVAFPGFPGITPLIVLGIGLLIVLALAVAIVLMYVSSRMRFVLFDSVVAGECHIREFWSRRGLPAFRYFVFQILILLLAIGSLIVLLCPPLLLALVLGLFRNARQHILALVFGGLLLFFIFMFWLVFFILVHVLTKDFVVPQMAVEDVTPAEGWRRLWAMMKSEAGGYAGYLGMKFVLSIVSTILFGVLTLIVVLMLLIPVGGVGAIAVLGGGAVGLTWNPITIAIAIVAGAIILLIFFLIASLISVPAIVFFPAYSIHFFAGRYPPLHALLFPPGAKA